MISMKQLDQLFWTRALLGMATGLLSGVMGFFDVIGILLAFIAYVISYLMAKYIMRLDLPPQESRKIFTTGLGSFMALWLFTWIIYYTILH
ncbi:MAG: hypothetical protein H3Z52_08795 [archaeon]|nr:hypothetical protein [archaeon]MCP8321024.1 hypothetical protein [archaeon]